MTNGREYGIIRKTAIKRKERDDRMQFSPAEKYLFRQLTAPYVRHPLVCRMKHYIQHGSISTFEHCLLVAKTAFWLNRRFQLGADEAALVKIAMLHDFYLYDWHEKNAGHRWHGFTHPHKAAMNAQRCFPLCQREVQAIESHMWPLTLTKWPHGKEAWVLCLADKYCALQETLWRR